MLVNTGKKIPFTTSEEFNSHVKAACQKFPQTEWSGVLLYTMTGTTLSDLSIHIIDFVPISVDTPGQTGFEYSTQFIEYSQKTGVFSMDLQLGDIHSHHAMGTFFSGTDDNDFYKNCPHYKFFVSIVVNNAGSIYGRVGVNGKMSSDDNTYQKPLVVYAEIESAKKVTPVGSVFQGYLDALVPTLPPVKTTQYSGQGVLFQDQWGDKWDNDWNRLSKKTQFGKTLSSPAPNTFLGKRDAFLGALLDFEGDLHLALKNYDHLIDVDSDDVINACKECNITLKDAIDYIKSFTTSMSSATKTDEVADLVTNLDQLLPELRLLRG